MLSFQVLKQKILYFPFRLQAREHDRIKRATCHDVIDIDRPPDAFVCLIGFMGQKRLFGYS